MIKAIQTEFKGYKFRSRLEARWAVFFESIGLEWEYEAQGFILENGKHYLPDFTVYRLGETPIHYEVKPQNFKGKVNGAKLLVGDPYHFLGLDSKVMCPRCGNIGVCKPIDTPAYSYCSGSWCYFGNGKRLIYDCYECDAETPSGGGNSAISGFNLGRVIYPHKGTLILKGYDADHWQYIFKSAVILSRQARFEHGEVPNV